MSLHGIHRVSTRQAGISTLLSNARHMLPRMLYLLPLICLLLAGHHIYAFYDNYCFVRATAKRLDPSGTMTDKAFLERTIAFVRAPNYKAIQLADQPWFGFSPKEILQTPIGVCGERTRVTILLLQAHGIKARRLHLMGPSPHVAMEAFIDGQWRFYNPLPMGQAYVDALTARGLNFKEELIKPGNPYAWIDYSYLNLGRLGMHRQPLHVPLPGVLTFATEYPNILRALVFLLMAAVSFGVIRILGYWRKHLLRVFF